MGEEIRIKLPSINNYQAVEEIGDFIENYMCDWGLCKLVIGLSGGVDSTVSAAITAERFQYLPFCELVGYMIPTKINNPKDIQDARLVAKKLGIKAELRKLDKVISAFGKTIPGYHNAENQYHKGNNISRARANILWTEAGKIGAHVQGTGNKDEDFGVGYYTLTGDGAVHFSPIGGLSKRLVKQLARYFGFDKIADEREPSAGLEPGQTDFIDLGYGYDIVELFSEGLDQGVKPEDLAKHPQIEPLLARQMGDWRAITGKEPKFKTPEDAVKDFLKRHDLALKKVGYIRPNIAPVTLYYK